MNYRLFGRLNWSVSEIGLGTYAMGGRWGPVDDNESVNTLLYAFDKGINYYDTADIYGYGRSESLLAKAFSKSYRQKVYLATKGGYDFTSSPSNVFKNFDTTYLRVALENSLKRLNTDYLDLYQLHGPNESLLHTDTLHKFLINLKTSGKVKACGISVYSIAEAKSALRYDVFDAIQYPINILEHDSIDELFSLCKKKNVAIIAREPLAQGLLTGKYFSTSVFHKEDFRSKEWSPEFIENQNNRIAELPFLEHPDRSLIQSSILYVLNFVNVTTVIPGVKNRSQLKEIIQSLEKKPLDKNEIDRINRT